MKVNGKSIEDGVYVIKNRESGDCLVNDATDIPKFITENEIKDSEHYWRIFLDGTRYKITSEVDNRFLNPEGRFSEDPYYKVKSTYILYGVDAGDIYSIRKSPNAGSFYWGINPDNTINGTGTESIDGYPFELIPVNKLSLENNIDDKIIAFYPNPVKDILNVTILDSQIFETNVVFSLYSYSGALELKRIISDVNTNINLENLETGIYFGVINSGEKTQTVKIIKL